jgi:transcriptional regulator with XRE-family HTH domain
MVRMLDFEFSTSNEITTELGLRLKAVRLSQSLSQADLAKRAGVSVGTVKALENTGQSSVASLVRVVQALGLSDQLQSLFVLKVQSIAEMEQAQQAKRQRAPRKARLTVRSQP